MTRDGRPAPPLAGQHHGRRGHAGEHGPAAAPDPRLSRQSRRPRRDLAGPRGCRGLPGLDPGTRVLRAHPGSGSASVSPDNNTSSWIRLEGRHRLGSAWQNLAGSAASRPEAFSVGSGVGSRASAAAARQAAVGQMLTLTGPDQDGRIRPLPDIDGRRPGGQDSAKLGRRKATLTVVGFSYTHRPSLGLVPGQVLRAWATLRHRSGTGSPCGTSAILGSHLRCNASRRVAARL